MSGITRMPPVEESRRQAVSFPGAHGITLAGHLYPARGRAGQQVYDQAPEPKQLEWIRTGNHVQLYDQQPYVPAAIDHIISFLGRYLTEPTASAPLTSPHLEPETSQ